MGKQGMGLQPFARHEDEQTAESNVDEGDRSQHHPRALDEQLANKRLAHPRVRHESVLAEPDKRQDWVEHVLVGCQRVDADGEGQYQLKGVSAIRVPRIWGSVFPHTQHLVLLE